MQPGNPHVSHYIKAQKIVSVPQETSLPFVVNRNSYISLFFCNMVT
jgi:hypothetical protein